MKYRVALALLAPLAVGIVAGAQTPPATQPLDSLGDATRVTLKLDKTTPREAFDRLEQASKLKITSPGQFEFQPGADVAVTANFDNVPYLSALLEICQQTGMQINTFGPRLMAAPAAMRRAIPPHVVAGPLAILCNAATVVRQIDYGEHDHASASLILNFSMISEPRVPLVGVEGQVRDAHAVDEHGTVLRPIDLPRPPNAQYLDLVNETRTFAAQLAYDPASNSLSTFSGHMIARVITKTDQLTIHDIAGSANSVNKIGDSVLTVTRVDQTGQPGQYAVSIEVTSASLTANFFSRLRFSESPYMPKLDPPNVVRLNNVQANGNGVSISMLVVLPNNDGKPVDLVWSLPSEVRRVEVPFEFHDLKLHP